MLGALGAIGGGPTTWQDVVLQLVNVLQVVLLAVLSRQVTSQRSQLDDLQAQAQQRRAGDLPPGR